MDNDKTLRAFIAPVNNNKVNKSKTVQIIHTSFLLMRLNAFGWLRNAAFEIVTPPNNHAAAPVYAVNKNVWSLLITLTAKQKS